MALLNIEFNASEDSALNQLYGRLSIQRSQIRLLYIYKATNFDEPIRGELKSKIWPQNIPAVTASCVNVLRVIRARGETNVRIDQVCIDQANLEERSSQVSLMDEIYVHATVVFVWLGQKAMSGHLAQASLDRDFPDMDTAVHALQAGHERILAEYRRHKGNRSNINYWELLDEVLPEGDKKLSFVEVKKIASELLVLLNVFERPYLERRWIIQEVTGHKDVTVLIGDIEMSLNILFDVALYLRSFYLAIMEPQWLELLTERMGSQFVKRLDPVDLWMRTVNVDLMNRVRGLRLEDQDIVWHVVRGSTFFRTKDPRDSLYSLRSMWEGKGPPSADYSLEIESVAFTHI